jgi:polysaccharide export outer membrane protein
MTGGERRPARNGPRAAAFALAALALAFAAAPSPAAAEERQDEYRIGAADTLDITVFGHDDLSSEVLVDGSGRISLPLLGQVDAGGKTIAELQAQITEVLDRDFIVEPRVSIEVTNYRPFYILGQVNKPGSYSYVEGMTVRMAVALAGGFTRRAREGSVVVIRAGDPVRDSIDAELDDRLFPGDTIEVERRLF